MELNHLNCPMCHHCDCVDKHKKYSLKAGEQRQLFHCDRCDKYFSETQNTAIAGLRTPINLIIRTLLS